MKHRSVWTFLANPFVVLADIMVSLVFIITLFLLTTTVYSKQTALIALRDSRRQAVSDSFEQEWKGTLKNAKRIDIVDKVKYQYGGPEGILLEVENDGSLQRFRFPSTLGFKKGMAEFVDDQRATATLAVFGRVMLRNRSAIKSLVIEGNTGEDEGLDVAESWRLSEARAETVRHYLQSLNILRNVDERKPMRLPQFIKEQLRAHGNSYNAQFNEWHLQEYQARHLPFNNGLGVFPAAWIISSGRGDQARRKPVVEFKLEYTERNTGTLDDYIHSTSLDAEARRQAIEFERQDIASLRQAP